jgi:acyl carrier protein
MGESDGTVTVLRGLWAEALDLERIELKDNFFELGGYSLLAMRVTAQVNKAFDVNIPIALVFRHPTFEGFAAAVAAAIREQALFVRPDHRSE